eukprot:scaffold259_cov252-Pinguiococcus_pyrenoidosus.AAC.19
MALERRRLLDSHLSYAGSKERPSPSLRLHIHHRRDLRGRSTPDDTGKTCRHTQERRPRELRAVQDPPPER